MSSEVGVPAPPSGRVLCVGEALIDIVRRPPQEGATEDIEHVGGSLLNVACGLARLGVPTELASWWGADERGARLRSAAQDAGVQVTGGTDGAERTSTALAQLNADGHASYTFDLDWQVPALGDLAQFTHLHTGSLALTVEPGGGQVLDAIERVKAAMTVSYDPNVRPSIMGSRDLVLDRIQAAVAASDLVKMSDEDLAWLFPGETIATVLERWITLGPAMLVITRGGNGAEVRLASDPQSYSIAHPTVEVADTVGAGDSFMAGLISGLLDVGLLGDRGAAQRLQTATWLQVQPALTRALTTAAITVTHHGAYAPTMAEVRSASA